METKNTPISFFSLLFHSLKVANQAFGSVLSLFIVLLIMLALMTAIIMLCFFLIGPHIAMVLYVPISLFLAFLNFVITAAVIQILAAKIEKKGYYSAWEALTDSVRPAFYFVLNSILLSAAYFLLLFPTILMQSTPAIVAWGGILCLASLPFMFSLQAITLREEGPISAFRYSWELVVPHYLRCVFTLIGLAMFSMLVFLGLSCIIKTVAPDLFFIIQMNPALVPSLGIKAIVILILFYAIMLYVFLTVAAAWTTLFLRFDADSRSVASRELEMAAQAAPQTPTATATANIAEVTVKQSSVRTDTDSHTAKQLDQVYSAQEHLARALEQEEDRMPTILFDEDMAKQLAETEEKMRQQKEQSAQRKEEDDQKSIKISDKPL